MPDLLLELFSEEIPARMQAKAADDLRRMVTDKLVAEGLVYEGAKAFATPRRLALTVHGIPARQPDLKDERKGPRVGGPDAAVQGFLKATGLKSLDEAKIQRDPKKGDFYVALIEKPGRPAIDVLADILPVIVRTFPWPKQMRWGERSAKPGALTWVRPLHSIVATFGIDTEDPEIVPFDIAGIAAGQTTRGHRFMAPADFSVRRFEDYDAKLFDAKVVLDPQRRRDIILADAKQLAFAQGFELVEDQVLLDEVAGLVEWPVVLMGSFDESFLTIPGEVIRATIRNNQKCFVVSDPKTGKLAPKFILTANIEASDGGAAIVAGNERVIRARLSDAKFFYETDLKNWRDVPLDERLKKFEGITFHKDLGSQGARIRRIERLAGKIAPFIGADARAVKQAARLAKADLLSEVVGEFPELQGLMGKYYALAEGDSESVALASEEHWKPLGANDQVPTNPVSIAVALADKLDTLVGFWAMGLTPSSSRDPFGLRRFAAGVARTIFENGIRLPLADLILAADIEVYMDLKGVALDRRIRTLENLREEGGLTYRDFERLWKRAVDESFSDKVAESEVADASKRGFNLLDYIVDRLEFHFKTIGIPNDVIKAALSVSLEDDLFRIVRRVEALAKFLDTDDGKNLLAGVKRASNILAIEEKKGDKFAGEPDTSLMTSIEKHLWNTIQSTIADANHHVAQEDFESAMDSLSTLRSAVDSFFAKESGIRVNDDDLKIRENRLRLLNEIRAATRAVADFSKIAD